MRKTLLFTMISLLLIMSGCGEVTDQTAVYDIADVHMTEYSDCSLHTFSFMFCTKEYDASGKENEIEHTVTDYTEEGAGGMRHVLLSNSCKYGYKDCYVVDQQHNEYLYLTKETYKAIVTPDEIN